MKAILPILGMVLITMLVGMGIIKLWMPELISNEAFIKTIITFGLIALGSFLTGFLSGRNKQDNKE